MFSLFCDVLFKNFIIIYFSSVSIERPKITVLGASLMAQMIKNPPATWEACVCSLGWDDPLEEGMAAHCSILPWRSPMNKRAWPATDHGVAKNQT